MPVVTNTYQKLNQDTALSHYPNTDYYDARNIHVVTHEGLSTGSVENEKGTKLFFELPSSVLPIYKLEPLHFGNFKIILDSTTEKTVSLTADMTARGIYDRIIDICSSEIEAGDFAVFNNITYVLIVGLNRFLRVENINPTLTITPLIPKQLNLRIIGGRAIRDAVVLFTTSSTNTTKGSSVSVGQIWKFSINELTETLSTGGLALIPSLHLMYNNKIDFYLANKIKDVEEDYKSEDFHKIYWNDGLNYLRHLNIADNDSLGLEPNQLDIVSEVELSKPLITDIAKGGIYKSGVVQYSYNLYNNNGNESCYSPLSQLVNLIKGNEKSSNTYVGKCLASEEALDISKTVIGSISGIDRRFSFIRIVAIYYPTVNAVPEIRIIDERYIPESGIITFKDDGSVTLGTVTLQELTTVGTKLIIPQTLTTKDNRLLAGNIEEYQYEPVWDARAYRFDFDTTTSKILHNTIEYEIDNNFHILGEDVPETYDCELPKTWQYSEDIPVMDLDIVDYNYAYNLDGVLGAQGPNVKINIASRAILNETSGNQYTIYAGLASSGSDFNYFYNQYPYLFSENLSFTNYASPFNKQFVGYQRDEVYRFGIRLINERGIKSSVRWCIDLKFPAMWESNKVVTFNETEYDYRICYLGTDAKTYFNILYPEFILSNLPSDCVAYEIVRAVRNQSDKTILGQGILAPTVVRGDYREPVIRAWDFGPDDDFGFLNLEGCLIVDFQSPEVNFLQQSSYEKLRVESLFVEKDDNNTTYLTSDEHNYLKTRTLETPSRIEFRTKIESVLCNPDKDKIIQIGGADYKHYVNNNEDKGYKGTSLVSSLSTAFDSDVYGGGSSERIGLFNILVDQQNQYSGGSYSSKSNTEYIVCQYVKKEYTYTEIPVFNGDTYVGYFDYLRIIWSLEETANQYQEILFFPVESTINLDLREPDYSNYYGSSYLQETAGTHETLVQINDLYDINRVYSKESDLIKTYSKPLGFIDRTLFDSRICTSEKQLNSINDIDYWTRFLFNDYIDVTSKYGPINKIQNFKNRVVFFQDNTIGLVSVNDRSLLQDSQGTSLVIGTGGLLDSFIYLSTISGTKHHGSVINTGDNLHFFDSSDCKWYMFTGESIQCISVLKNMSSWFRNNIKGTIKNTDTPLLDYGIHGIYDMNNLRVLMTFLNGSTKETIAFNELTDSFESFYDYAPGLYIGYENKVFVTPPVSRLTTADKLYLLNRSDYGNYFDTVYVSYITPVINPNYDSIKRFDNFEWNSEVFDGTTNKFDETLTYLHVFNEHQDTGEVLLAYSDTVVRRFRAWHTTVPFDMDDARIRGQYCMVKLIYDNVLNRRIVLTNLNTFFV